MRNNSLLVQVKQFIKRSFPRLWIELAMRVMPRHFERELWLIPLLCDENRIAIDVGANQGVYSYYMSKFAKKVVAFEPNADLLPALRKTLNANVEVENSALSDTSDYAVLKIDPSDMGLSTIEERNRLASFAHPNNYASREIPTRTLDNFRFSNISLIKIDVEGHEEAVIRGAEKTIRANNPVLIIESENQHNTGAPVRLEKMLSELGYTCFYLYERSLRKFSQLRAADTDLRNLFSDTTPYINNFIFIPTNQIRLIEKIKAFAAEATAPKPARSPRPRVTQIGSVAVGYKKKTP
jgi:FkbM family methyltransferase